MMIFALGCASPQPYALFHPLLCIAHHALRVDILSTGSRPRVCSLESWRPTLSRFQLKRRSAPSHPKQRPPSSMCNVAACR